MAGIRILEYKGIKVYRYKVIMNNCPLLKPNIPISTILIYLYYLIQQLNIKQEF